MSLRLMCLLKGPMSRAADPSDVAGARKVSSIFGRTGNTQQSDCFSVIGYQSEEPSTTEDHAHLYA